MQCLPLHQLSEGQIVARPITNKEGAVLCPAGFVLTDAAIQRLDNVGIGMVFVETEGETTLSPEARLEALEERFSGVADPVLLQLKQVIEKYLRGLTAEGGSNAPA